MYGVDRLLHLIGDIWLYAVSAQYALREGFEIELHTDSLGALLLSHIPYNHIYKTLDNIPKSVNPRFWAAGKVWAMEAAGDNAVHIDGDVFIKDRLLLDFPTGTDFIVQSEEDHPWTLKGETDKISSKFSNLCLLKGFDPLETKNYNMGVIGILNPELRNLYIKSYKDFVIEASLEFAEGLQNPYTTPDLLCELLQFSKLANLGYKKYLIIEGNIVPKGYLHLITSYKYSKEILDKVKETLKLLSPELYKNNLLLCQNI